MLIRKAKAAEAECIASYVMLAMGEIAYQFIGERSYEKAIRFLTSLISRERNQYSYENCWVVESGEDIIAVAIVYDGALLKELRKPVAAEIKLLFNKDFDPEDETQPGEYYIDCIAVKPDQQGRGVGSNILQFIIEEYVSKGTQTLGLLVDKDNPQVKKLYLKLGFEMVEERTFAGKRMEHLQIKR